MATNLTADGTTEFRTGVGKNYLFTVAGTFGSGTVTLQWTDGTNDVAYPDGALTADGGIEFSSVSNPTKVVLSGATNPNILVNIVPVSQRGGR